MKTPIRFAAAAALTTAMGFGALAPAAWAQTSDMAEAEVRKIDLAAAKVTLKHGEIKSLDMPPMTMVFTVRDKASLETLKTGDKVRFKAINEGGKYTVTEIQVAR